MVKKKKQKIIVTVGKRKDAIAKASVSSGTGKIWINSKPLNMWGTGTLRMMIEEALLLSDDLRNKVDIDVAVRSGGTTGQAEAVRMSIARGLVEFFKNEKLRQKYMEYDRNLLIFDPRRNEPHHGHGASKRGSRRHKQRSKR